MVGEIESSSTFLTITTVSLAVADHMETRLNTHLVKLPDSGQVTSVNQGLFTTTMEAEKRHPS